MRTFVRVAQAGSFSDVARRMGGSVSMVTRQVAALEQTLGTRLLRRTTRRLTLTPAGATYLERARPILAALDAADEEVRAAQERPAGTVRLSVPLSFGLRRVAPILPDFLKAQPALNLAVDFSDRPIDLLREQVDVAIRITDHLEPGQVVRKLGEARLMTLAAPTYLASKGTPEHPRALVDHDILGFSPTTEASTMPFQAHGQPLKIAPTPRMLTNNGDALLTAAIQGLGITMQPDFIAREAIERGDVVPLLTTFEPPPLGIHLLLPPELEPPRRVRVLVDFLVSRLSTIRGRAT
ncbi:MAG: LysR substrate-binding domain-containing protein [Halothiobacillaceae bacterium]